ncbi:hypothetical protein [Pseudomonas sp. A-B-19]|uniref:hypothetical protein n=1 Tax=Pseudomonas sp. A-B-19 TaxID=2832405 RepID=UPI001CBAC518|nr:hypothetical protein [Pseudomonas sp. A-B-19]
MISRFKWYAVRVPCSVEELLQRLARSRYEPTLHTGFIVDVPERSFQFIWRTSIYATTISLDGISRQDEVVSICSQKVKILGTDQLIFRMEDPPRSSKELLNRLDKILGFGFSCEQIFVTDQIVRDSIKTFQAITLNSLKLSGSISSISAIARVEIASKVGIDPESIEGFGLSQSVVDAGSYSVRYKGLTGQVGFTRTGICKLSGDLTPRIQACIETTLMSDLKK